MSNDNRMYALEISEIFHKGCIEDESQYDVHKNTLLLLPEYNQEDIDELKVQYYEDQDYSYNVHIEDLGYVDFVDAFVDNYQIISKEKAITNFDKNNRVKDIREPMEAFFVVNDEFEKNPQGHNSKHGIRLSENYMDFCNNFAYKDDAPEPRDDEFFISEELGHFNEVVSPYGIIAKQSN